MKDPLADCIICLAHLFELMVGDILSAVEFGFVESLDCVIGVICLFIFHNFSPSDILQRRMELFFYGCVESSCSCVSKVSEESGRWWDVGFLDIFCWIVIGMRQLIALCLLKHPIIVVRIVYLGFDFSGVPREGGVAFNAPHL